MHPTKTVHLACTDCHGGNSSISVSEGADPKSSEYKSAKEKAHVQPHDPIFKNRSAVPEWSTQNGSRKPAEYVKFVNPGDLRVAPETCGGAGCHASETRAVSNSMMTHTGMLWGAALYNNGGYPQKTQASARAMTATANPSHSKQFPHRLPKKLAPRAFFRNSIRFFAGKFLSRQCPPCLRTRRRKKRRNRQSEKKTNLPAIPTTS